MLFKCRAYNAFREVGDLGLPGELFMAGTFGLHLLGTLPHHIKNGVW